MPPGGSLNQALAELVDKEPRNGQQRKRHHYSDHGLKSFLSILDGARLRVTRNVEVLFLPLKIKIQKFQLNGDFISALRALGGQLT